MMRPITLFQPQTLVFGRDCSRDCAAYLRRRGCKRALVITAPPTRLLADALSVSMRSEELRAEIYDGIDREPTIGMFHAALDAAKETAPDAIVGLGGGSPLDVAKLIAAFLESEQRVEDAFGIDLVAGRNTILACVPTTAGTGSEVSPNAILLDEVETLKKGVVSRYLVPDATFVDPVLTVSMPPAVTAGTGLDALTHCIEAYTNKFAHPVVDLYAREGIRLIAANLTRAVACGGDLDAREAVALGSLYGGLCLGPVNTAAVHALSYPLGGEFHVPHGISNAVLLPHVMDFNLSSCPERYAEVAAALGAERKSSVVETARQAPRLVLELAVACGAPLRLSDFSIPRQAIPRMSEAALKVTRLLKNNPRELLLSDAAAIYERAF